ncbi:MAG TPA: putative peptidoglycan glycosyltransferase FtsW [Tepidisphaeraceae bacterium]|nr:putative peptidoglycan glycosyltransferase FtsW [Tepidisphaeraceae bacterium]
MAMEASIYRLRLRDILTVCVVGLLFLGFVMVQSASAKVSNSPGWALTNAGEKHAGFVGLALITFFLVGRFDYRRLNSKPSILNPVIWILMVSLIMCGLVLVPHVGREVNGARRWLGVGPVQVQPSELAKWAIVLFLAWWLASRENALATFKGLLLVLLPIAAFCFFIVKEDFGTAALIASASIAVLLVANVKWWHLAIIIPPAAAAGVFSVVHKSYRMQRMTAFLNPWADPRGIGYHMIQSLLSFSSGGIVGRGLGNGIQKLGYLPEDTTDFIFAVICEELGLFGAILTIALYLGILYVVWRVIRQQRDAFAKFLALGVGCMIGLQAVINIAVATVSVPTKGLSLPLVSAGGSGLIITSAALGLLYSITRFEEETETIAPLSAPVSMLPVN